ncbi:hypothetical protein AMS68_002047 [Peltaster fructicola]|uniref:Integral membrane bound transporter domain-containing protein n=1 Tax=Peltaster fructicola TaxID=286661 RepID=A0A6H0XPX5_9PEZI|nr:hypothetical protein AMS68_002047 [Peltaster fructicola]
MASSDPSQSRSRLLRPSTFIVPSTGERVKRVFSLRDASRRARRISGDEGTPLLNGRRVRKPVTTAQDVYQSFQQYAAQGWQFACSSTGQSIFKCSLAYLLGSMATFIPAIANAIGEGNSKHLVATVTIWFHPARTIGSMQEVLILAVIGLSYAAVVSLTSMGVSVAFARHGLLQLGHMVILVVFCGGGLGAIAWVKQHFDQPLVNIACAMAALGFITTLVKEGSVQEGAFSTQGMSQILVMILLGILVTSIVNSVVLPMTARARIHKDIATSTDLQGENLINITRAFLSGEETVLSDGQQIFKDNAECLGRMNKNLAEAQKEYFFLGYERQFIIEARLVKCLSRLSQDLGGLRSAASTQFSILGGRFGGDINLSLSRAASVHNSPRTVKPVSTTSMSSLSKGSMLDAIAESDELDTASRSTRPAWPAYDSPTQSTLPSDSPQVSQRIAASIADRETASPADMFVAFIAQLGPPAKSLAYTLKQILDVAPFDNSGSVHINKYFHPSLSRAIEMYKQARREALESLYHSRALTSQRSSDIVADLEEVAASCGHFSFSLLDFAEDCLAYLETLEDLKTELEKASRKRSWTWLMFWRRDADREQLEESLHAFHEHDDNGTLQTAIPASLRKADKFVDIKRYESEQPWTYRLYRALRLFRRDDVHFSIKVGVGGALFALAAFLPDTRPTFNQFRGEWGLVSYMVVCSMTLGASNTTGLQRIMGTSIGAILSIFTWFVSNRNGQANPYILAVLGWLVSAGCFYLILASSKGAMGRFALLTYNLGALYAYSVSVRDTDNSDDEGGVDPAIWSIVFHRVVSVIAGTIWAIVITRFIWPISARKKFQDGMCVLWIRMSLIWKRDPLAMFLVGVPKSSYMDIREEAELQGFLTYLDSLRKAALSEFELRGPFPNEIYGRVVESTRRMLESFHAMNVVMRKQQQCTDGEAAVLRHTRDERFALSARISHLFSVLASSLKLEYPLNDVLPNIEDRRNRLLTKLFEFRRTHDIATETDYELFYAYLLVTGQLAQNIEAVIRELENLFGTLDEENLKLR